jgi:hypothetical protein
LLSSSSSFWPTGNHFLDNGLQIPTEALGEKYLGLPTVVGRGSTDAFGYIPSHVSRLVGGWAERNLSCAAREVLLKANAQAVPTYSMSCFKLQQKFAVNSLRMSPIIGGVVL